MLKLHRRDRDRVLVGRSVITVRKVKNGAVVLAFGLRRIQVVVGEQKTVTLASGSELRIEIFEAERERGAVIGFSCAGERILREELTRRPHADIVTKLMRLGTRKPCA